MRMSNATLAGLMLTLLASAGAGPPSLAAASSVPRTGDKVVAAAGVLPFIADDSSTALAEAKRRGVPIFVEAWAPW